MSPVVIVLEADEVAYLSTVLRRARADNATRWPSMQRGAADLEDALTDALRRLDVTPPAPSDPAVDTDGTRLLTTAQAAALCRVTTETVRRWIRAGDLPHVRLGRATRIDPTDLERFLDDRRHHRR